MTAETRPERSKRLASEANRARRNLQLRADSLARSLVEQRGELAESLREPAYGLGRRLLSTVDDPRATPMPTDPASVAARRAALRGRRAA